jgi:hypothetical protein
MENINLNTPYKIIPSKHKRYTAHYEIPSSETVVIPKKKYGDQISCEVLWKEETGEVHRKTDLVFDSTYLEPLNSIKDYLLFTLWESIDKEVSVK